jgi:predicted enzyme related to lactoylglutathione lyase
MTPASTVDRDPDGRGVVDVIAAVPYRTVDDLERHLAHHVDLLGYDVVEELRDESGHRFWASLRCGEARLMSSDRPVHDRTSLTWLYVRDVDAAYRQVLEPGGSPLGPPTLEPHGNREFLVEDPSGDTYVIAQTEPR